MPAPKQVPAPPASTLHGLRAQLLEAMSELEREHPVLAYKILTAAMGQIDQHLRQQ